MFSASRLKPNWDRFKSLLITLLHYVGGASTATFYCSIWDGTRQERLGCNRILVYDRIDIGTTLSMEHILLRSHVTGNCLVLLRIYCKEFLKFVFGVMSLVS